MTPDDLDLEKRISSIEEAMRGDMKGNPGMIQQLIRLMNEIYNPNDGHAMRLRRVEDWQNAKENWAKGAYFAWAILGIIIGFLLTKYVFK